MPIQVTSRRFFGKRERRTVFMTRGRSQFSIITCSASGSEISMAGQIQHSSGAPPPFLPGTESDLASRTGNPPRITSPTGGRYALFASLTGIPLRAKTDADVREIYWFADKTFIGKSNVTGLLTWKSPPG